MQRKNNKKAEFQCSDAKNTGGYCKGRATRMENSKMEDGAKRAIRFGVRRHAAALPKATGANEENKERQIQGNGPIRD
jgi:hypothetical protein